MKKIIFNKQRDLISIIAPASGCPDASDKLDLLHNLRNMY